MNNIQTYLVNTFIYSLFIWEKPAKSKLSESKKGHSKRISWENEPFQNIMGKILVIYKNQNKYDFQRSPEKSQIFLDDIKNECSIRNDFTKREIFFL